MAPPVQTSVWVGMVSDETALEAVLEIDATACEGDALGSAFSRAAGQASLGTSPRESKVLEAPTSVTAELLVGLSFHAALCAELPARLEPPCNAVVVFFGAPRVEGSVSLEGVRLRALVDHAGR